MKSFVYLTHEQAYVNVFIKPLTN